MESTFVNIYEQKKWGDNQAEEYSGSSGFGSTVPYNKDHYIPFLKKFIQEKGIKTVVDLGCGDFLTGPFLYDDLDIHYIGYDAYEKLVHHHQSKYDGSNKYAFHYLDFFSKKESIVSADLCILKDVLQHWSLSDIYSFLDYLFTQQKFKYILICNSSHQSEDNTSIETGGVRPLSCHYLPLRKYKPVEYLRYHTKEVSVIEVPQENTIVTETSFINLILTYYGTFPNYFQLYLDSLAVNQKLLRIFLITDIDLSSYTLPPNLIVVSMTIQTIRERTSCLIQTEYGKTVSSESLLLKNYKLVDLRPVYMLLFQDILQEHGVKETDYVGWGDCDVIYGNLSHFINLENGYEVIGGHHGHFSAFRNTEGFRNLFKSIPDYLKLLIDNSQTFVMDEIHFRTPLTEYLEINNYKRYNIRDSFCDIVPPCFYHLFRQDHATRTKNFFHISCSEKNIKYLYYDTGKLMIKYETGELVETSYCHLQKRAMALPFKEYKDGFYIGEHTFFLQIEPVIPLHIYSTWSTKDLPPKMKETVELVKQINPEFEHHLFDDTDCHTFIKDHFPKEILMAYEALAPSAYKADLWRYCVMYIHGGIYIDIKFAPLNTFKFTTLTDNEYFVRDGIYVNEKGQECVSVFTGLLVCKPKNQIMLQAICKIVQHVSQQFYGVTPWDPTGPRMIGTIFTKCMKDTPFQMKHYGTLKGSSTIVYCGTPILETYPEYRTEQSTTYYVDHWTKKTVYKSNGLYVQSLYTNPTWAPDFMEGLERGLLDNPLFRRKRRNIHVIMSDNRSLDYDLEKANYWSLTAYINKQYCDRFGYDFSYIQPYYKHSTNMSLYSCIDVHTGIKRHSSWAKLLAIQDGLQSYEYVVYIDSDCVFKNFDTSIEDMIHKYPDSLFLFQSNYPWGGTSPCAGFFISKNTPKTKELLDTWYTYPNPSGTSVKWNHKHPIGTYWEQDILWYLVEQNKLLVTVMTDEVAFHEKSNQYIRHVFSGNNSQRIPYFKAMVDQKIKDTGISYEALLRSIHARKLDTDPLCNPRNPLLEFNEEIATPLCEIMGRHGSDKGSKDILRSRHNYTTFYYTLVHHRKEEPLRIFELGLGTNYLDVKSNMGTSGKPGASLRGWAEFFPKAVIFGADIDRRVLFEEDRIKTYYCDQLNPVAIKEMWDQSELKEGFDLIIEDGLHEYDANVCFLEHSLHKLNPRGIYIIEDILTSTLSKHIQKIEDWKVRYPAYTFDLLTIHHRNTYDNNVLVVKRIS